MEDYMYLAFLSAYKKWSSTRYIDNEPFCEQNKQRAAAWEEYVKIRDIYQKEITTVIIPVLDAYGLH